MLCSAHNSCRFHASSALLRNAFRSISTSLKPGPLEQQVHQAGFLIMVRQQKVIGRGTLALKRKRNMS